MSATFIEGPDSTRLLAAVSANDYDNFAVSQTKQFVPVTRKGDIVTDGILLREELNRYTLSGVPAAQSCTTDPDSGFRQGANPVRSAFSYRGLAPWS